MQLPVAAAAEEDARGLGVRGEALPAILGFAHVGTVGAEPAGGEIDGRAKHLQQRAFAEPLESGQVPGEVFVDLDLRVVIQRPKFAAGFHNMHFLVCRSDHSERYHLHFTVRGGLVAVTEQTVPGMNDLAQSCEYKKMQ